MTDYLAATYGDRIADVYDELYEFAEETDAAVELVTELAGGGPVLELGIGTGRLARSMRPSLTEPRSLPWASTTNRSPSRL